MWSNHQRSLAECGSSSKGHSRAQRAVERRSRWAEKIREDRGVEAKPWIRRRDVDDLYKWGNMTHLANMTGVSPNNYTALFGNNISCVLTPDISNGPFYIEGEYLRTNVTENQVGVPLYLDVQIIDVNTCEPLPDLFVDIWSANATGVYSGVHEPSNGNYADIANLNATFLRGIWQADDDGVVQFATIFPGHYGDRATHVHMMYVDRPLVRHKCLTTVSVHHGGYITPNYTFHGGNNTHIGQLFFEESLRSAIEATAPYTSNAQPVTANNDDEFAPDQATGNYDPYPKYLYIDPEDISKGVIAWISMGVDPTSSHHALIAGWLTEDGGVPNPELEWTPSQNQ
ncbi:hypothetical protein HYDPIDRAFT_91495 [Hydnomerulius pinastri MD-312]|uniref:Intradiol ring-cleavage dioxygenases domain-containing protein n=1 Tax=Hydnomerulius pinastri MD-312 TaxID=994086 RepID=A0A0C9WEA6_9AGAM|nr:hypothetical protein HYDPIDRAFT_91495 [Hydnomerulius pinastri MD-312]